MKLNYKMIFGATIILGTIFLVMSLRYFPLTLGVVNGPGEYLLLSVFSWIFWGTSVIIMVRQILRLPQNAFSQLELLTASVQLLSAICLFLFIVGFHVLFPALSYMAYLIILLGIISYYKHKTSINFAFITWGGFILLWRAAFYGSVS